MNLGDEKYLSLVTFKRSGDGVATPVWVARVGDDLGIITEETAGKVKRIRNNSRVTLTPCDIRGRITPGSSPSEGTARIVFGEEARLVDRAVRRKYKTAYYMVSLSWVVPALIDKVRGRGESSRDCAILVKM